MEIKRLTVCVPQTRGIANGNRVSTSKGPQEPAWTYISGMVRRLLPVIHPSTETPPGTDQVPVVHSNSTANRKPKYKIKHSLPRTVTTGAASYTLPTSALAKNSI